MALDDYNTLIWRREHGVDAKAEAVLAYSTSPAALDKLRLVLRQHRGNGTEPLPNTLLVTGDATTLTQWIAAWRETLTPAEFTQVRGGLISSRSPTADELAHAILNLFDLDSVLAKMQTRWLVQLLAEDALFVVFQPLVSVKKQCTIAFECLLRGNQRGVPVGAAHLLQGAAVLGMSHELDIAAWRAAFRQGRGLVEQGHHLFLNFTPSSIFKPMFDVHETQALAKRNGISFSNLVFEVTEAEKVHDLKSLKTIMDAYRAAGAKVALDDLGSGYASMGHLAALRPDYVKLDQGLVHGAHGDKVRAVLLRAIVDAAHDIGIEVVAEGVETAADMAFCIDLQADLLQGYYLARPGQTPPTVSPAALQALQACATTLAPPNGP